MPTDVNTMLCNNTTRISRQASELTRNSLDTHIGSISLMTGRPMIGYVTCLFPRSSSNFLTYHGHE